MTNRLTQNDSIPTLRTPPSARLSTGPPTLTTSGEFSLLLSPQALGVLLCAGLLVIAGWTAIPAGAQSSPTEISDWTDLQAIDNGTATLSDDYVLVNDLDRNTAGYDSVVLNQTDTFTETIFIRPGETTRLTRTPVDEILSVDYAPGELNLTLDDGSGDDGSGDDGSGPGFGPGAVLAGLSGVGYLLRRRLNTDKTDSS